MSVDAVLTVTAVRWPRTPYGEVDRSGEPVARTEVPGCCWWPVSSDERYASYTALSSRMVLSVPYGADIKADDDVLVAGDPDVWHVIARPTAWSNPLVAHEPGTEVIIGTER